MTSSRIVRTTAPVIVLLGILLLAGCSSGSDDTDGPEASGTSAPDAGEFCDEIEAAGATGASFGPVLLSDLDEVDRAVAEGEKIYAVTPPKEITEDWDTRRRYLESLGDWSDAGGPGGTMIAPDSTDSDAASQRLTDFFLDTCA